MKKEFWKEKYKRKINPSKIIEEEESFKNQVLQLSYIWSLCISVSLEGKEGKESCINNLY